MTAPTVPPVSNEEPVRRRPRFALPHGWWRRRPHLHLPGGQLLRAPWVLGLAAALWAAAIGLLLAAAPMLILWLSDLESGWVQPLRHAGLLWLVAQGAPISIAGVTLTLIPWGLVIVPLALLSIGGAWAARRTSATTPTAVLLVVLPGVVLYTVLAAVIDVIVSEPAARVDLLQVVIGSLVVALLGLGWGALRGSGLLASGVIPAVVAVPLRAGFLAVAFIVGMGAVAATVSLLVSIDDAVTMARALGAGLGGGVGLLMLGVAYVPVISVWGATYLLGAGVALGPTASVSPFVPAGAPAALPPFPLLAALPQQAPPFAWALPLVGVIAGLMAGALIGRRLRHEQRLVRLAAAAGAAAIAGAGMAALAWLSSGSLGTDALAGLGPDPSVVAVLTVLLVVIGAVPAALVPSPPARPALVIAEPVVVAEPAVADPTDADPTVADPTDADPTDAEPVVVVESMVAEPTVTESTVTETSVAIEESKDDE